MLCCAGLICPVPPLFPCIARVSANHPQTRQDALEAHLTDLATRLQGRAQMMHEELQISMQANRRDLAALDLRLGAKLKEFQDEVVRVRVATAINDHTRAYPCTLGRQSKRATSEKESPLLRPSRIIRQSRAHAPPGSLRERACLSWKVDGPPVPPTAHPHIRLYMHFSAQLRWVDDAIMRAVRQAVNHAQSPTRHVFPFLLPLLVFAGLQIVTSAPAHARLTEARFYTLEARLREEENARIAEAIALRQSLGEMATPRVRGGTGRPPPSIRLCNSFTAWLGGSLWRVTAWINSRIPGLFQGQAIEPYTHTAFCITIFFTTPTLAYARTRQSPPDHTK